MNTPTKLKDITLGRWVDYYNRHGHPVPTGDDTADYVYDLVNRWCYYTGKPQPTQEELPDVLREQAYADTVLNKEKDELNYNDTFLWKDAVWKIAPVVTYTGKMSREDFEVSQDIALIFSDLQDGKEEALFNLCAAYMRKEGEPYHSDLVDDRNERVELMKELPLHMALCVKAYVEYYIDVYLKSIQT